MKVFFRRIHLYLSFAAGLVILLCCGTGAILVFEKELLMAGAKERYYVAPGTTKLSADTLIAKTKAAFPGHKMAGIRLYEAADRSAEVSISAPPKKEAKPTSNASAESDKASTKPEGARAKGEGTKAQVPPGRQPGFTVFINPYTGQVLEKYSYRETWLYQVFALHRWLLGGEGSVGKYIVGVSTFIFLFIILTGIILWWPKTTKVLKQRLAVKWDASWKRLNHDFHIVFGFYSAIFLFIFAFTGLAWSFEWFNNGIYKVTGSPLKPPPPPKSTYVAGAKPASFDAVLAAAKRNFPSGEFYNVAAPKDSTDIFNVSLLPKDATHESATTNVYVDQYTGAVIGKQTFADRSTGARVRSTFKPVHTGSIWGLPSKIIAFIVCLLGVTFPITGTIMWWNRTRKKKASSTASTRQAANSTA